jgi:hypothetical protein
MMPLNVFVIMPFSQTPARSREDLTEFFLTNLKRRIESDSTLTREYVVRRSDDTFDITAAIITNLYTSDVVLCDLSGIDANPNVMYELGVRLALTNRPVILIRESNPNNRRIFDIAGFYINDYDPKRYRPLEDYIIQKLRQYESSAETFASPVLTTLAVEPSIVRELTRARVVSMLESLSRGLLSLLRGLGPHLVDFLVASRSSLLPPRDNVLDLPAWLLNHGEALELLDWQLLGFEPGQIPALMAFLEAPPLCPLLPADVCLGINTFCAEYYGAFFSVPSLWRRGFTFNHLAGFLTETYLLYEVLESTAVIVRLPAVPKDVLAEYRRFLHERLLRSQFAGPWEMTRGA